MINKVINDFEIISLENKNGLRISGINNSVITIYDVEIIEKMVELKFNQKYRQLLYIVTDASESSDTTDSDIEIILLQIDALKNKLINKYFKFININTLNKYLKMLYYLEEKLNNRIHHRGR